MKVYDLMKDGFEEIIVGRDDGRLNVYTQDAGLDRKTALSFTRDIGKRRKGKGGEEWDNEGRCRGI